MRTIKQIDADLDLVRIQMEKCSSNPDRLEALRLRCDALLDERIAVAKGTAAGRGGT